MIKVQVELERPVSRDEDPTFTVTIEDKESIQGFFKSDGLKISDVEQLNKDIFNKLRESRNHYNWMMKK